MAKREQATDEVQSVDRGGGKPHGGLAASNPVHALYARDVLAAEKAYEATTERSCEYVDVDGAQSRRGRADADVEAGSRLGKDAAPVVPVKGDAAAKFLNGGVRSISGDKDN